jgi:hypothetical protein
MKVWRRSKDLLLNNHKILIEVGHLEEAEREAKPDSLRQVLQK